MHLKSFCRMSAVWNTDQVQSWSAMQFWHVIDKSYWGGHRSALCRMGLLYNFFSCLVYSFSEEHLLSLADSVNRRAVLKAHDLNFLICRDEKENLTPECKDELLKTQMEGAKDYRTDADLHLACESDAKKICKDVKPGEGRIQDCLVCPACIWSLLLTSKLNRTRVKSLSSHTVLHDD